MAIHYILEADNLAAVLVERGMSPAQPKDRVFRLMNDDTIREEIVKNDGTLRLVHHTSATARNLLGRLTSDAGGNLTLDGVIVGAPPDLTPYALAANIPPPPDLTPYALAVDVPPAPDLTPYATATALADALARIAALEGGTAPVITIDYTTTPPNAGTFTAATEGDSVSAILSQMNAGNPVASDGSVVTVTRALYLGANQVSGTVQAGNVITEARFTATAVGAAPVVATVALNVTVGAAAGGVVDYTTLASIEALKTDKTTNGSQWPGTYKRVGVNPLPTGVTYSAPFLTFGATASGVFEGWEMDDVVVVASSGCDVIFRDNIVREVAGITTGKRVMVERTPGSKLKIEWTTFIGSFAQASTGGADAVMQDTMGGTNTAPTGPVPTITEHCRFIGWPKDGYKMGTGTIRRCYFGPPVNLEKKPVLWRSDEFYPAGTLVWRAAEIDTFRALIDNAGVALPATKGATTTTWQGLDPHSDLVNPRARIVGDTPTVAQNYLEKNIVHGVDGETERGVWAIGVTNGVRAVANSGYQALCGGVLIDGNIITDSWRGASSAIDAATQGDQPLWSPNTIRNNRIEPNNGGTIFANGTYNGGQANTESGNVAYARPAAVLAFITQSGGVVGFGKNINSVSGPMPELATQVDSKFALNSKNDKSGVNTVRTVNQAAITALDVGPGMVAFANVWHKGSGGQPSRVIPASIGGSSLNDMLDSQLDTVRITADDLSHIQFAEAQFGPADHVNYVWWNSEATAASDLIANRAPHLLGLNPDGTPYTYPQPGIDYSIINRADPARGMFNPDAILDLAPPGISVQGAELLISPPRRNYRTNADGSTSGLAGMVSGNAHPAIPQRKAFRDFTPIANRGKVTNTLQLMRFGDYTGGVKAASPSETLIHPAITDADGQQLYGRHTAAMMLVAEGFLNVPRHLRTEVASDGTYADFIVSLPNAGLLTTMRKQRGMPVPSTPRPHQQLDGMGFVIRRSGDTVSTERPIHRSGETSVPAAYRGTVTIQSQGHYEANGTRVGVVRVVPDVAFAIASDEVHFGMDGGYGGFILHGHPDYDARLYLDGLIEHIPHLAPEYDGMPIEPQVFSKLSAVATVGATPTPPPPPSSISYWQTTATGPYIVDPSNAPTGLSKIRFQTTMRIPSAVTNVSGARIIAQESIGCDIGFFGEGQIYAFGIEDNGLDPNQVIGATTLLNYTRDTWFILDITVNHATNTVFVASDLPGDNQTFNFTKTSTGFFQSTREFSLFARNTLTNPIMAGVEFQRARLWFNDNVTPHIDVTPSNINTHVWKQGANAIIVT